MKSIFILLHVFALSTSYVKAQNIHSPAEIFQIMDKSETVFSLNPLNKKIQAPDRTENINTNFYYRKIEDSVIRTYEYTVNPQASKFAEQAEGYFRDSKYGLAQMMYEKAYSTDTSNYQLMTYIGQMYGIQDKYDIAAKWYQQAISKNYIDYMAHWFFADIYKDQGKINEAVEEITIALILNRNNPRIKSTLVSIYKLAKLQTDDWDFTPQIQIDSTGPRQVSIMFGENWLGYAMVKSLWMYEPGYAESMGTKHGNFSILEEKERFNSLLTVLNKKAIRKNPEFAALQRALDNRMIDEYIIYEILLPNHPFVAYQLSEQFISDIKDYIITVRGGRKQG